MINAVITIKNCKYYICYVTVTGKTIKKRISHRQISTEDFLYWAHLRQTYLKTI